MNRRSFFASLAALIAAPVVGKQVERNFELIGNRDELINGELHKCCIWSERLPIMSVNPTTNLNFGRFIEAFSHHDSQALTLSQIRDFENLIN